MAKKDSEKKLNMKARNLIIVSILLALLLFVSYYNSLFPTEEEVTEEEPIFKEEEIIEMPEINETEEPELEKPTEVLIEIVNFKFIPREINITVGTTVVWKNLDVFIGDVRPHMIAHHYNEFRSGRLLINDTFNHTFTKIGRYTYNDAIFPTKMRIGVINVVAQEKSLEAITGNVVGVDKNTAVSALIIFLIIMIIIGLYESKKLHLIYHKNK